MRRRIRALLVLLVVVQVLPGTLAAQQAGPVGQLAVVNGSSSDPVTVAVGGSVVAENLEYASDAVAALVSAGTQTVAFTGGTVDAATQVDVAAGSAMTVVSGYGEGSTNAHAYPIDLTPIAAGTAKVTVWNATTAPVEVAIGGSTPVTLDPGAGTDTVDVTAQSVDVVVGGVMTTVATSADSYTDVFAVDDGSNPTVALSIIPSMDALIAALQPEAPDPTTVPDVVGDTLAEARATLVALGLAVATIDVDTADDAGTIVGTNPTAGVLVAPGSTVTLFVSTGSFNVVVPDVVGLTAVAAEGVLEDAGFTVVTTEESDTDAEAGRVISTNPAAGIEVAAGTRVTMVVAAPITSIVVPDVVGLDAEDARAALEDAGLTVVDDERSSADVPEGDVIETSPAAGATVAPGTVVTMTVSSGVLDVFVPDFTGLDRATAAAEAERAGLVITFVEDPDEPDPDGIVVSQTPEEGEFVPAGTEVVAQLSPLTGEPWVILTVDPNRLMTVSGINFLVGSTVILTVESTDLLAFASVDDSGAWVERFDLAGVETPERTLLVEGIGGDGSDYVNRFIIPALGTNSDPEADSGGLPWWALLLIGVAILSGLAGVLVWRRRAAAPTWQPIPAAEDDWAGIGEPTTDPEPERDELHVALDDTDVLSADERPKTSFDD